MWSPEKRDTLRRSVLAEYARLAPHYDRRWFSYVAATSRETLRRLSFEPTARVLDLGCGTGAFLSVLALSNPGASLGGVDPSPQMLAVARKRLGRSANLTQGWAEAIPFADESFDLIVCCSVFHYIRNPSVALKEMTRVLRPLGTLVITDWCDDYLVCRICDLFLRTFNRAHFRMYRERECHALLEASGLAVIDIERYKISWLWGLMTATAQKGFGLYQKYDGLSCGDRERRG